MAAILSFLHLVRQVERRLTVFGRVVRKDWALLIRA
jgi:hypothetical protein